MTDSTGTSVDSIEYHIKVGTCKDCKWWGVYPDDNFDAGTEPTFDGDTNFKGVVRWCNNDLGKPESGAFVDYDTIQTHAVMFTGPDFGCIHHEPKEK